jgi:hypothetical protein
VSRTLIERAGVAAVLVFGIPGLSAAQDAGVPVTYQLPTDGPLPKTYRVTLAVTPADEPDWIVSTFVAGEPRTVTEENQGRFTDSWNGLDENDMPAPPGEYAVKGIYMPAEVWGMDGRYHSLTARYVLAAGDSWTPAPERDDRFPWIFGHAFGNVSDVQAGPDGRAGFLASYVENSWNPFLVDLERPIGFDQVLEKYDSSGTDGGVSVAADGELTFAAKEDAEQGFVYRMDHAWGPDRTALGVAGKYLPEVPPSMLGWLDPASGKHYLYVAQPGAGRIRSFDGGDPGAPEGTPIDVAGTPQAVTLDRESPGQGLYVLHRVSTSQGDSWLVSRAPLTQGEPVGDADLTFEVPPSIGSPIDLETDTNGRFYLLDKQASQLYQLDETGAVQKTFASGAEQTPGSYDSTIFMAPHRLASWNDAAGQDRILVVERAGPGRVSEWSPQGELLREWFLIQNANVGGYAADPTSPNHLYVTANYPDSGSGLIRFEIDYATSQWAVDAVWPDICRFDGEFPGGVMYPRIIERDGVKYLGFAGGQLAGNGAHMIYRLDGDRWIPSAGIVEDAEGNESWWHDANGDGEVQPDEHADNPANLPSDNWWGHTWLDDLSLVVTEQTGYLEGTKAERLAPSWFDSHGNPVYDGYAWETLLADTVYEAKLEGTADALHGGNEVATGWGGWERIAGSMADGFYVADPAGPANPGGVDTAGYTHSQFKLSRYVPSADGGFEMRWRVGRKAWRLLEPGQVYGTHHVGEAVHGLVGTFDSNGLYHVYTDQGLYVDTLMMDAFRHGLEAGGMYSHSGESWFGQHVVHPETGVVYLLLNRTALGVYEVEGWEPGLVTPLEVETSAVTLRAEHMERANEHALDARGGPGTSKIAKIVGSHRPGGPELDGSMVGWGQAPAARFQADDERTAEVRAMFDEGHLYLRAEVSLAERFVPQRVEDTGRLFTREAGSHTVSVYLQGDRQAEPGSVAGRSGDVRFVLGIVEGDGGPRPVVLGMYPEYFGSGEPRPRDYSGPSGTASFEHVAELGAAQAGHAIDADGHGFVVAAAIPESEIPLLDLSAQPITLIDYEATFDGTDKVWWANAMQLDNTATDDDAAAARLYPGSWVQGMFVGLEPPADRLQFRYDAGALASLVEGEPVSSWPDSSGNGLDLQSTASAEQPVFRARRIHGQPAVSFDGGDDQMYRSLASTMTGDYTLFGLYQSPDAGWTDRLLSCPYSSYDDWSAGLELNANAAGDVPPRVTARGFPDTREFNLIGLGQFWGNTTGSTPPSAEAFHGDLAEVLAYSPVLAPEEFWAVEDYLESRYAPGARDEDGDSYADGEDCAAGDPGVFSEPAEVRDLGFRSDERTLVWQDAAASGGPDTRHDVVRGLVGDLPVGAPSERCIASGIDAAEAVDEEQPDPASGFYYLVRARNTCGTGTYGTDSAGATRASTVCP